MRARFVRWVVPVLSFVVAVACGEDASDVPPPGATSDVDGGGSSASGSSSGSASSSSGSSSGTTSSSTSTSSSAGGPDAAADAKADAEPDAGPPFDYRDINHVLGTGQSLSVGSSGAPVLSTTQPFDNLMFNTGVIAGGSNLTSFVPLVEGTSLGGAVETHSSAFANLVTLLAQDEVFPNAPPGMQTHDLLISGHGIGGTPYAGLKKGTVAFANGIEQVKAAKTLAAASQKSYIVRAITNVHGESDHIVANAAYATDLATWQSDYDTDVKAITGQTNPIPMLQTQMSSWTKFSSTTSTIPIAQLTAHIANPGKVILVGPKYHLPYIDGVHLTNKGYQHMGEDYAKVYRRVILERGKWEPLRPLSVTRADAIITVKFIVPVPPLVLDDEAVSDPGNFGFEFVQDGAPPPAIVDIEVTGPDTVRIELASAPAGQNKRLRYAYTGTLGASGGPTTGPRGNLRDSDATVSRIDEPLFNWCVHFDESVP